MRMRCMASRSSRLELNESKTKKNTTDQSLAQKTQEIQHFQMARLKQIDLFTWWNNEWCWHGWCNIWSGKQTWLGGGQSEEGSQNNLMGKCGKKWEINKINWKLFEKIGMEKCNQFWNCAHMKNTNWTICSISKLNGRIEYVEWMIVKRLTHQFEHFVMV